MATLLRSPFYTSSPPTTIFVADLQFARRRNTFVAQHPVAAFVQGWDRLNMPERLRRVAGKPLPFDVASFVSS